MFCTMILISNLDEVTRLRFLDLKKLLANRTESFLSFALRRSLYWVHQPSRRARALSAADRHYWSSSEFGDMTYRAIDQYVSTEVCKLCFNAS